MTQPKRGLAAAGHNFLTREPSGGGGAPPPDVAVLCFTPAFFLFKSEMPTLTFPDHFQVTRLVSRQRLSIPFIPGGSSFLPGRLNTLHR